MIDIKNIDEALIFMSNRNWKYAYSIAGSDISERVQLSIITNYHDCEPVMGRLAASKYLTHDVQRVLATSSNTWVLRDLYFNPVVIESVKNHLRTRTYQGNPLFPGAFATDVNGVYKEW